MVRKNWRKKVPATNLQGPESARRVQGGCEEGAGRERGGCEEGARMVQGDLEYSSEKVLRRQHPRGGRFLTFLFDQRQQH